MKRWPKEDVDEALALADQLAPPDEPHRLYTRHAADQSTQEQLDVETAGAVGVLAAEVRAQREEAKDWSESVTRLQSGNDEFAADNAQLREEYADLERRSLAALEQMALDATTAITGTGINADLAEQYARLRSENARLSAEADGHNHWSVDMVAKCERLEAELAQARVNVYGFTELRDQLQGKLARVEAACDRAMADEEDAYVVEILEILRGDS